MIGSVVTLYNSYITSIQSVIIGAKTMLANTLLNLLIISAEIHLIQTTLCLIWKNISSSVRLYLQSCLLSVSDLILSIAMTGRQVLFRYICVQYLQAMTFTEIQRLL